MIGVKTGKEVAMAKIDYKETLLRTYILGQNFVYKTSQDIVDDMRDMCSLTVDEVSEYMMNLGGETEFIDGRMVWTRITENP